MLSRIHKVGIACGAGFLFCYLLGLWFLSGFVPAHQPTATAEEIVAIYQANTYGIQFGMLFVMIAAALYLPWTVTFSSLVRLMEGESDFLSKCQLLGGLASSMFFVLPALVWQVAAFRMERSPELFLMLNDAGWILTVTPVPPFLVQWLPLAAAIFISKKKPAVLPRWFGYFTIWCNLLYLPGAAAYFFKTGPFAWNGLFAFWIPLSTFAVWEIMMMFNIHRVIKKEINV